MKTCKLFVIAFLTGTASVVIAQQGPMPFHGMPTYPYPDDSTPPVTAEQMRRFVPESELGLPGALPQALAPVSASR